MCSMLFNCIIVFQEVQLKHYGGAMKTKLHYSLVLFFYLNLKYMEWRFQFFHGYVWKKKEHIYEKQGKKKNCLQSVDSKKKS